MRIIVRWRYRNCFISASYLHIIDKNIIAFLLTRGSSLKLRHPLSLRFLSFFRVPAFHSYTPLLLPLFLFLLKKLIRLSWFRDIPLDLEQDHFFQIKIFDPLHTPVHRFLSIFFRYCILVPSYVTYCSADRWKDNRFVGLIATNRTSSALSFMLQLNLPVASIRPSNMTAPQLHARCDALSR